ncbi:MAG: hypothetical protein SNJ74_11230 [Fimbriimonadaceae bacterium]
MLDGKKSNVRISPATAELIRRAAARVSAEYREGAKLAVRHRFELGHRRILIFLEASEADVPDVQASLAGFLEACAESGLTVSEVDVRVWGSRMEEADACFASRPPHTAVLAWKERQPASCSTGLVPPIGWSPATSARSGSTAPRTARRPCPA